MTLSNKTLIFIFFLALIIRIPIVITSGDRTLENEFCVLVHNLLNDHGYSFFSVDNNGEIVQHIVHNPRASLPTATIPPVYPLFLAGMCFVFGTGLDVVILIEIIQALIGAMCCIVLYWIVAFKFNKTSAFVSALLFCFYPILVYLCGQISAANVYVFINLVLLFLLFKGEKTGKTRWFFLAGLAFGLLLLSRAEVILYAPFILLWISLVLCTSRAKRISVFAVAALIVWAPWAYRNYKRFDAFVPLTTQGGYNLWQGQNPQATGTRSQYTDPPFQISPEKREKILSLQPGVRYELELDKIYMNEALMFMTKHPTEVLKLALRKFVFYWGYYWGIKFTYPGARSVAYWLPWFILLPFFMIGLIHSIKDVRKYCLFHLYFILSTLIAMLFFVIPRYRLFILPLIFPFAVEGFFCFLTYCARSFLPTYTNRRPVRHQY